MRLPSRRVVTTRLGEAVEAAALHAVEEARDVRFIPAAA